MSYGVTTADQAELAVDLYCLLLAQVEVLRELVEDQLRTEHQRAMFGDRVAARARQLRREHPEAAPAIIPAAPVRPTPVVAAAPGPATNEAPLRDLMVYGSVPRLRLSPLERARREAARRWDLVRAQTEAHMQAIRGGAA